jgi:hypothetical protein
MVFRSHPIGACCMRSGRLQGFIPQNLAHFEEHILTLHTACAGPNDKCLDTHDPMLPLIRVCNDDNNNSNTYNQSYTAIEARAFVKR